MNNTNNMIGSQVEYESGGQKYTGMILDRVRVLGKYEDAGQYFDLYLVKCDGGRIFKISPTQVKQVLSASPNIETR